METQKIKTAVVVLNWNGKAWLEKFLANLVKHSQEATVFVADNASTDDSVDFVKSNFPSVKIIINASNGGYAKGYNDALKQIEAEYFVLINSDIEVTDGWLSPIINKTTTSTCIFKFTSIIIIQHFRLASSNFFITIH